MRWSGSRSYTPAGAGARATGGAGLRCGRRDPDHLRAGDALDFWRVAAIEPGHLLGLRAEMKLSGPAWPGWNCRCTTAADRRSTSNARCFIPVAWSAASTGTPCCTTCHRLRRHGPQHRPGSRAHPGAPRPPSAADPRQQAWLPRFALCSGNCPISGGAAPSTRGDSRRTGPLPLQVTSLAGSAC